MMVVAQHASTYSAQSGPSTYDVEFAEAAIQAPRGKLPKGTQATARKRGCETSRVVSHGVRGDPEARDARVRCDVQKGSTSGTSTTLAAMQIKAKGTPMRRKSAKR